MDHLGPDIFSTLRMKEHVLHCARAHLNVPGSSLVWNALLTIVSREDSSTNYVLTRKLPTCMFLSRLNEISGGCEKILPVAGSL